MSEYVDQIFKLIRIGYYSGMFLVIFILILDSWRVMKNVREGQLPHRKSIAYLIIEKPIHSIVFLVLWSIPYILSPLFVLEEYQVEFIGEMLDPFQFFLVPFLIFPLVMIAASFYRYYQNRQSKLHHENT